MACEASGLAPLTVHWRSPAGQFLNVSSDGRVLVDDSNTLTINQAELEDEGKWSCVATNPNGVARLIYTVHVIFGTYHVTDCLLSRLDMWHDVRFFKLIPILDQYCTILPILDQHEFATNFSFKYRNMYGD